MTGPSLDGKHVVIGAEAQIAARKFNTGSRTSFSFIYYKV